jgi:hypothetical protein
VIAETLARKVIAEASLVAARAARIRPAGETAYAFWRTAIFGRSLNQEV